MNDYILTVIRKFADDYLETPTRLASKGRFEQRSYSRWAIDEILRNIAESPSIHPVMVVESFIRKMDSFSCLDAQTSIIFSIARDTAEHLLDVLIGSKRGES